MRLIKAITGFFYNLRHNRVYFKKAESFEAVKRDIEINKTNFENIVKNSKDGILVVGADGIIKYLNESTLKMFDMTEGALIGHKFGYPLVMGKAAKINIMQKDSSIRDVEMISEKTEWYGEDAFLILMHDVTEWLERERKITEASEEWRRTFDSISDMIIICDKDLKVIKANKTFLNLNGINPKEIIGRDFFEIVHDKQDAARNLFNEKVLKLKSIQKRETFYERLNMEVDEALTPVFDEKGNLFECIIAVRDISERKKIQNAQRLSELGRLVYDIAHEVNNPLMIISANAELALTHGLSAEEVKDSLRAVRNECRRANDIMQRLFNFSKPTTGERSQKNINNSITALISIVEKQLNLNNIIVKTNFADNLPLITVDERQIQEVLLNLLNNARDAMQTNGTITITTYSRHNNVIIEVEDTGAGMDKKTLAKVLEPFYTTKEQGTGLGLPVCLGIIKAHSGRIEIKSEPAKGTDVKIFLPVK